MTFNPAACLSILKILENVQLPDRDLAIDFGSQRYTAAHIFPANSTRDFYLNNGFKDYMSLDVNDDDHNIKCDLNEIIDREPASLVTNIGTGEHIFDQNAVFTNMHNLCKVGGVMFCHLPFTPWLNHGLFNYNPILFEALADVNKYQLLQLDVGDREGNMLNLPYDEIVKDPGQHKLEQAAKLAPKPLFVFATFLKVHNEPFRKPFQKRYKKDIKSDAIKERYV
jgi:hypothetical protein